MNKFSVAGLGLISALVGTSAHAAIETTTITTAITEAGTAAGVVGAAVLAMIVGVKAYKYIRGAL